MNKVSNNRSCSSMVAVGSATRTGQVILAKNSDRPMNEAQPLCYFSARDYVPGAEVKCTFISIPQVTHTYACIGSKPHIFFGFEHGVNECGVAIGNEQVSGREVPERKWGLIGMDILRLALERADTAAKAIEIMGNLLEAYGTGGSPDTRISAFNSNYIVADGKEAYLFESHQRSWVAKRVIHAGYLSNCYSILDDYTHIGDGVIREAEEKGWVLPGKPFRAAHAWTIDDCNFAESEGFARYARLATLMNRSEPISIQTIMTNLRDHYDDVFLSNIPYSPAAAKIPSICSHPGGVSGCATAASMVAILRNDVPKEIKFTYWGSMAPPCCSIFRPFYNINWLPEDLQEAVSLYRETSQWWKFIELERYIALNYDKFGVRVKAAFGEMEKEFIDESEYIEATYNGDVSRLKQFSLNCTTRSFALCKGLIDEIKAVIRTSDIDRMLLNYFAESSNGCGMPYDSSTIK